MKTLIPIVGALFGVAALIFGFAFHDHTVHFDEAIQIEAPPLEPDPFMPEPEEPPEAEVISVLEERQALEPEYRIVLEVSRGGVTRLADGTIKRTYVAGESPPALCPT